MCVTYFQVEYVVQCTIRKVGPDRKSAPYMTVCMVICLPKYRIYTVHTYRCMVLANPNNTTLKAVHTTRPASKTLGPDCCLNQWRAWPHYEAHGSQDAHHSVAYAVYIPTPSRTWWGHHEVCAVQYAIHCALYNAVFVVYYLCLAAPDGATMQYVQFNMQFNMHFIMQYMCLLPMPSRTWWGHHAVCAVQYAIQCALHNAVYVLHYLCLAAPDGATMKYEQFNMQFNVHFIMQYMCFITYA